MQVVDLQGSEEFQALGVELLSLAPDSVEAWRDDGERYSIREYRSVLSDEGNVVAGMYDVMRWQARGDVAQLKKRPFNRRPQLIVRAPDWVMGRDCLTAGHNDAGET